MRGKKLETHCSHLSHLSHQSHRMSGAIRDNPVAQMLFYFCGCREIRLRELNTDSRLPVTLSTLRRNPDYFPVNRDFLRLIHECQQNKHLFTQLILFIRRNKKTPLTNERHVGGIQYCTIFNRQREYALLIFFARSFSLPLKGLVAK